MSETSPQAACARHPETPARAAPCARCGDFLCERCFSHEEERTCLRCVQRTGADRIAWERPGRGLARRFAQTSLALAFSPAESATEIARGGRLGSAVLYLLGVALAAGLAHGVLAIAVFVAFGLFDDPLFYGLALLGALVQLPIAWALGLGAMGGLAACAYHLSARVLGGVGSFESSARAVLYQSGLSLWLVPASILGVVPVLGLLANAAAILMLLFISLLSLHVVARQAHALSSTRAWLAASAATAVIAGIGALAVAGAFLLLATLRPV